MQNNNLSGHMDKKGLTASLLAISACYFCTQENKWKHTLLRLDQISHQTHCGMYKDLC